MGGSVLVGAATLLGCGNGPSVETRSPEPGDSTAVPDTQGSETADTTGEETETVPIPGLRATYFAGYLDRALEQIEPTVDVDWGDSGPTDVGTDRFSARWTGTLTAEQTGSYTLILDTDDGVRLWIDDTLVIDDWTGHFVTRNTAAVALVAGVPVDLRLEYFEIDLAASIRLSWASDTLPEQVIPAEALSTPAVPNAVRAAPKPPYTNPVIPFDCPDPGVIGAPVGGEDLTEIPYAMVCTGGSFPIRTSRGLVSWTESGAALLPDGQAPWAANGYRDWAPELHQVDGRFVGYYTSADGGNTLAIGATVSTVPGPAGVLGPYTDLGSPLLQHPDGVIDASWFEDTDGSGWLLYKPDSNAQGDPTAIFVRALAPDGLSFLDGSTGVQLLANDPTSWEGGVVEAPWLVRRGAWYYLFYSGNVYDDRYRTGVARSADLLGPYEKYGSPILANNERWVGPGHGSVVPVGDQDWFVYHAWVNDGSGSNLESAGRRVLLDRIDWVDDWPVIHDGTPSRTPQPWPGAGLP